MVPVFVRSHAEAGDQVRVLSQRLRYIAMKIHGGRYDGVVANSSSYSFQHIAFGIIQALHTHGTMNVEIQAIVGGVFLQ